MFVGVFQCFVNDQVEFWIVGGLFVYDLMNGLQWIWYVVVIVVFYFDFWQFFDIWCFGMVKDLFDDLVQFGWIDVDDDIELFYGFFDLGF